MLTSVTLEIATIINKFSVDNEQRIASMQVENGHLIKRWLHYQDDKWINISTIQFIECCPVNIFIQKSW